MVPVGLEELDYIGSQPRNGVLLPIVYHGIIVYALYIPLELFLSLVSVEGEFLCDCLEIHGMLDDLVVISDAEALFDHRLAEILASLLQQAFLYDTLGLFSPVLRLFCCLLNDLWVLQHVSQLWIILY